jgi:hypothetical protein
MPEDACKSTPLELTEESMIGEGVFREDCLSLCCLQASPAAAEPIMNDEGTRSVSESGCVSLVTFFAHTKKVTRPSGAKPNVKTREKKVTRTSRGATKVSDYENNDEAGKN